MAFVQFQEFLGWRFRDPGRCCRQGALGRSVSPIWPRRASVPRSFALPSASYQEDKRRSTKTTSRFFVGTSIAKPCHLVRSAHDGTTGMPSKIFPPRFAVPPTRAPEAYLTAASVRGAKALQTAVAGAQRLGGLVVLSNPPWNAEFRFFVASWGSWGRRPMCQDSFGEV